MAGALKTDRCGGPSLECVTYTCTSLVQSGRLQDVLTQLGAHVIGLQGTRYRSDRSFRAYTRKQYFVWDWVAGRTKHSNSSTGVMIALRRGYVRRHHARRVWQTPPSIQGRGGAIRVNTPVLDACFIVGYVPPESTEARHRESSQAVYAWMHETVSSLPTRCMPVVMLDANGHMGCVRWGETRQDLMVEAEEAVGG